MDHPDAIIGDLNERVLTLPIVRDRMAMISQLEPKNVNEALEDKCWVKVMHDELD